MTRQLTLFFGVALGLFALLINQTAFAANNPVNGLKVSPAIINLQASKGQDTLVFDAEVTNVTNTSLAVNITTKDFGALNANGSIGFYGSNYKSSNNSHSLASAISLPSSEYLISAHQTQNISINIDNINKLSPGGHYSALIFTPFVAINGVKKNQIGLQPSVASLVFLTTASGGTQSLKLSDLNLTSFGFSLPQNAYILLTNVGNTQIVPRGTIKFTSPTSKLIAQSVINSDSGMILPNTSRLYTETINTSNNLLKLPGIYHFQLKYRIDGSSNYQVANATFFYLNPLVFVVLIFAIFIIKYLVNWRRKRKQFPKTKRRFRNKKD